MFKSIVLGLVGICGMFVFNSAAANETANSRTEPKDLVSIQVAGTTIDLLPKHIDVVTSLPEAEVNKLVDAGGEENKGDVPDAVFFRGVLYLFATAESWREATNHDFEDGDVIYTYLVESDEERTEFTTKYDLQKVADLRGKAGHSLPLWRASPGHYVLVATRVTVFACVMHPHVAESDAGNCPICGMELIPTDRYE